jgi:hypothetical protein
MTVPMLKNVHRRAIGISPNDQVVAPSGFVSGGDGKPAIVFPSHDTVAFWDDFLGQNIHTDTGSQGLWGTLRGADTGADGDVDIVSGATNGVVRLRVPNNSSLAAGGAGATNISALLLGRHFGANQGRVRFAARVRIGVAGEDTGTPNGVAFFAGFTDDTGTLEFPIHVDTGEHAGGTTGELRSVAASTVGMLFDTATDTGSGWAAGKWHGVAAAAAGLTTQSTADAHEGADAGKWQWVEVELDRTAGDTGGVARFWLNGRSVGTIQSPVASSSKLTPIVIIAPRSTDTGSHAADVDMIAVSGLRDTGS